MDNKGFLYNMGGWSQLFFFFIFFFAFGLPITILVTSLSVNTSELWQSPQAMRMALMIQSVCMYLIPPLMFAYLCQENPKIYLKIEGNSNIILLLLAIALIVVIQPLINTISYYNQQVILPESFASIESWMKEKELFAEKTVNLLFGDKSLTGLVFNLLVIAIVAGLCEEFFFRGCLQQITQKIVYNKHAAIWITALIFSAIHFQFYGFIPRLLLGALLGYLFVWANSIWIPVIVHTIHNAINVILPYIYYGTPDYEKMENFKFEQNMWMVLFSFILSLIFIFLIYRKREIESVN